MIGLAGQLGYFLDGYAAVGHEADKDVMEFVGRPDAYDALEARDQRLRHHLRLGSGFKRVVLFRSGHLSEAWWPHDVRRARLASR